MRPINETGQPRLLTTALTALQPRMTGRRSIGMIAAIVLALTLTLVPPPADGPLADVPVLSSLTVQEADAATKGWTWGTSTNLKIAKVRIEPRGYYKSHVRNVRCYGNATGVKHTIERYQRWPRIWWPNLKSEWVPCGTRNTMTIRNTSYTKPMIVRTELRPGGTTGTIHVRGSLYASWDPYKP